MNLLAASEELRSKGLGFSATAEKELKVLIGAVSEILNTAERAFSEKDLAAAAQVEPLKQVIVALKEQMRTRHIPVSYTHLITAMGGVNGWTYWIKQYLLADKVVNVSVAGSTWQDKVASQTYDGNPQPVSYTHLDVYKRQL